MIQRYNQKPPKCTYCLAETHTAFKCGKKPNKTLNTYAGLKISSSFGGQRKPMKKVGKQGKRTQAATAAWKRSVKPNSKGLYKCHYCPAEVSYLMPEHMESKARRPDLRTDPKNFVPTCANCNAKKGSKSHDEIPHDCTFAV